MRILTVNSTKGPKISPPGDVSDEHPVAVLVLVRRNILGSVEKIHQLALVHAVALLLLSLALLLLLHDLRKLQELLL